MAEDKSDVLSVYIYIYIYILYHVYSVFVATYVEKTIFTLLNSIGIFVESQLTLHLCIYF